MERGLGYISWSAVENWDSPVLWQSRLEVVSVLQQWRGWDVCVVVVEAWIHMTA